MCIKSLYGMEIVYEQTNLKSKHLYLSTQAPKR